jgi:glycosyltransferase involved in cell wall biosynthesis
VRVAIVTDWFLKLVVEGQATSLQELGHDVLLVCRAHANEFGGDVDERRALLERLRLAGVEIVEVPGRRFTVEGFTAARAARGALRRWGPDVVSAHENLDPRLLAVARGFPLVYTVHDPTPHPGAAKPSFRDALATRLWLHAADTIVVHGVGLVEALPARIDRGRVRVVPHGIEVQPTHLPPPEEPTILNFGRMEPYKGLGVLVAAMEAVWSAEPRARLVLAGRGPAIAGLADDDRVEVIDRYVPETELRDLLRRASLVALPYTEASQSGVGLLAIAHGIPIVVTQVGALPMLAPSSDYVVEPCDPEALARGMLQLLRGDQDGLRKAFLEHAAAVFSWPKVAASYVQLYGEAVSRRLSR